MNNRYDFVYLFDITDGNPNGDPDAGNLPRIDSETGHGLITDVCLKRKVRNYIGILKGEEPPYEIYVKEKAVLNSQHERAYKAIEKTPGKSPDSYARQWMCQNFYDIRTFGAVMSTQINCGQVRGPVQIAFSRSIDPIVTLEHAITRCAVTTEKEAKAQEGDNRTMGRKFTVPYALYRTHGFVNPYIADESGFSENDLELLWQSFVNMFELDRSAARGQMVPRALIVFKHETKLGNAPSHKLFKQITVSRKDTAMPARNFSDYHVSVDSHLPAGITMKDYLLD